MKYETKEQNSEICSFLSNEINVECLQSLYKISNSLDLLFKMTSISLDLIYSVKKLFPCLRNFFKTVKYVEKIHKNQLWRYNDFSTNKTLWNHLFKCYSLIVKFHLSYHLLTFPFLSFYRTNSQLMWIFVGFFFGAIILVLLCFFCYIKCRRKPSAPGTTGGEIVFSVTCYTTHFAQSFYIP